MSGIFTRPSRPRRGYEGKAGEAITRGKLRDSVAGEQVSFKTSDGTRTRQDFVTADKGTVETKTGNAQLLEAQEKFKADVDAGRPVTPNDVFAGRCT